jgi:hypothetical protein
MTSSPPAGRPLLGATPGGCFIEGGRPHRWTESLSRRSGGLVFGPRGARLSLRLSELRCAKDGRRALLQGRRKGTRSDQILHGRSILKAERVLAWLLDQQASLPSTPRSIRLSRPYQRWRPGKRRGREHRGRSRRAHIRPGLRSRNHRESGLGLGTGGRAGEKDCEGSRAVSGLRICLSP